MQLSRSLASLWVLLASLALTACHGDSAPPAGLTGEQLLRVVRSVRVQLSNGDVLPGAFRPTASELNAGSPGARLTVSGPSEFVPGSTARFEVTSDAPVRTVAIDVEFEVVDAMTQSILRDVPGLWEVALPTDETEFTVYVTFEQSIPETVLARGIDVSLAGAAVPGLGSAPFGPGASASLRASNIGTGDLQVNLTWPTDRAIELYVVDPTGEVTFARNPQSVGGGRMDAGVDPDCVSIAGPVANVYWVDGTAALGTYYVFGRLREECGGGDAEYALTVTRQRTPVSESEVSLGSLKVAGIGASAIDAPYTVEIDPNDPSAALPGRTLLGAFRFDSPYQGRVAGRWSSDCEMGDGREGPVQLEVSPDGEVVGTAVGFDGGAPGELSAPLLGSVSPAGEFVLASTKPGCIVTGTIRRDGTELSAVADWTCATGCTGSLSASSTDPAIDVAVTLSAAVAPGFPARVDLTVALAHPFGALAATGLSVELLGPEGATFQSGVAGFDAESGVLPMDDLLPGAVQQRTVSALLDSVGRAGTLSFEARLSPIEKDIRPENDEASVSVDVPVAELGALGNFAAPRFTAGGLPRALAVGDLDGDGWHDLVIAAASATEKESGHVRIYYGSGQAEWTRGAVSPRLAFSSAPSALGILRSTETSTPTLVIAEGSQLHRIDVLDRNAYSTRPPLALPGPIEDVTVADLGDRTVWIALVPQAQLAVAGDQSDGVLLNVGLEAAATSIQVGELTGDGLPDLAVTYADAELNGGLAVLPGNAPAPFSDGFAAPIAMPWQTARRDVLVCDLDSDGLNDLIAFADDVSWARGLGGGAFSGPLTIVSSNDLQRLDVQSLTAIAQADLDLNDTPDLVMVAPEGALLVVRGTQFPGEFLAPEVMAVSGSPEAMALGDLNGDAFADLVVLNHSTADATILFGLGGGGFDRPATRFSGAGVDPRDSAAAVALEEFDGDGRLDAVLAFLDAGVATVERGDTAPNAGGWNGASTVALDSEEPVALTTADLDGDGAPDLLVLFEDELTWLPTVGGLPSSEARVTLTVGPDASDLATGDLNGDGALDVAVANRGWDNDGDPVTVYLTGVAPGAFAPDRAISGAAPSAVSIADVDGNGVQEILAAASNGVTINTNWMPGSEAFEVLPTESPAVATAVVDVSGDGLADLVVALEDQLWFAQSTGSELGELQPLGTEPLVGSESGYLNLLAPESTLPALAESTLIALHRGFVTFYRGGRASGFEASRFSTLPFATDFALGDLDADGRTDVVSAHAPGERVGDVYFPRGDRSFADRVLETSRASSEGAVEKESDALLGSPDGFSYSLGAFGSARVAFDDNALVNSGDATPELWISETGAQTEIVSVEVLPDAETRELLTGIESDVDLDGYFEVGTTEPAALQGLDLDAAFPGFESGALRFTGIEVTDVEGLDSASGNSGADIDAIGAIGWLGNPAPTGEAAPTLAAAAIGHVSVLLNRTPALAPNVPPACSIAGRLALTTGVSTTFDASGSLDPDGEIVLYTWDFGDGTAAFSSESSTAEHTYVASGTYQVSLTVTDDGDSSATCAVTVLVADAPVAPIAAFEGTPTSGSIPLTVSFVDQSSGLIDAWSWDFGDGASSIASDPDHDYTIPGSYAVSLTVTGPGGVDTLTRTEYIVVTPPPPTADFSGTPTSGDAPLDVDFADASTGEITSWSWDFGDGATSVEQSPSHTYLTSGSYTVALTVTGPGGSDTRTRVGYIDVGNPPPVADFSGTPTSGDAPLLVAFADLSTGLVTSWSWDFGDGASSTEQSPVHTYTAPGTFTVSLTATGPGGSDTRVRTNYIVAETPAPVADFSGTPTSGDAPLDVDFADASTGEITSWSWDFGDGATSVEQSPSHTYLTSGSYTVALTVTGPGGSDTRTRVGYIDVGNPPPVADFTGTPTSGDAPLLVAFADLSTGLVTSWSWDFGDGASSTEQSPVHTYTAPGTFTVSLTATGPGGSDTRVRTNYIVAETPAPVADFSGTPTSGDAPLDVDFADASTGEITSWSWDFGDGATSVEQSPSHTYLTSGSYTVALTVTGPGGSDTRTRVGYIDVGNPPPVADFTGTPTSGDAPLLVAFADLSTGLVTSWSWDFGDGASSTEQSPTHTYTAPGTFTVSLTATGPGGSDTRVRTNYIVAETPAPVADFSGTPTSGDAPLDVDFADASTGEITSWSWDFGDGGGSSLPSPSHTYSAPGDYTVSLTVTGPGGSDTLVRTGFVQASAPAPLASFTGTPINGVSPLDVNFADSSSGPITQWSWDFGDGGSSSAASPTHTYLVPGVYSVALTVTGPGGTDTLTRTNYIDVGDPPPIASFSATPTSGDAPLAVAFTDASSGNITLWSWDFGDGSVSANPNPNHVYTTPGTFTVSLTVAGPGGSDTSTQVALVDVGASPPVAGFSGAPLTGVAPLDVFFSDASTGTISTWSWSFGDGGGSAGASPAHTYALPGTYSVELTVSGPGGSDTLTRTDYITVLAPAPIAGFSGTPTDGVAPLEVAFTDLSSGPITGWSWDFGDGNSSLEPSPTHIYTSAGNYTVSLMVSGPGGVDEASIVDYVTVLEPAPFADFGATPTAGIAPLDVNFTDLSSGLITSWSWDFGDGATSTEPTPSHTYTEAGLFTVSLAVTGPGGTDVAVQTALIDVAPAAPVAAFGSTAIGEPWERQFNDLSSGSVTSWLWEFGGGAVSTDPNPVHTFVTMGGVYDVTLTVTGPGGMDTVTQAVNVAPFVDFNFSVDPAIGYAPFSLGMTNLSQAPLLASSWDFGDGGTSMETHPTYVFQTPGSYSVTLTATGPGGVNSTSQLVEVQEATFTDIYARFAAGGTCTSCHTPAIAPDMTTQADAYANLVNAFTFCNSTFLVDPGSPDTSYLLEKVEAATQGFAPTCGAEMPPAPAQALSADDLVLIRAWITAGAPNN